MSACHGIPKVVVSDNGPQFSAELYAESGADPEKYKEGWLNRRTRRTAKFLAN